MKGLTSWIHRPFKPCTDYTQVNMPCICRVTPDEHSFTFQWFDLGFSGGHTLSYRKVGDHEPVFTRPLTQHIVTVSELEDSVDYEFTVSRVDAHGTATRLVRTGKIPGDTVINYLHPKDPVYSFSGRFLGSPNIVRCPSGRLIAAMDVFFTKEHYAMLTILYCSDDGGKHWRYLGELAPCYWPKLFMHRGTLYCIAATQGGGNLIIGCSEDEGEHWTAPVTLFITNCEHSLEGNCGNIVEKDGRLYIPIACGTWGYKTFRMSHISVNADSDLMNPANWEMADFLEYDPAWPGSPKNVGPGCGSPGAGIEGNMIIGSDGTLHCCYRMDIEVSGEPNYGKMLMLDVDTSHPGNAYTFNAVADCPLGSNSKFCVNYDSVICYYVMLGTEQVPEQMPKRTVLSMAVSHDLRTWRVVHRIYDFRDHDPRACGFQYPDWAFDGDDILLVTRVGYNMSDTHHNSNCITFKRIKNFRQYF